MNLNNLLVFLLTLVVVFSSLPSSFAQEVPVFSLEEAIAYAHENNINVKIAKQNIQDADAQIVERRAAGIPQLNGSIEYDRFLKVPISIIPGALVGGQVPPGEDLKVSFQQKNSFNAGLNLTALIFDGAYFTALEAAKVFKEYVSQELIAEKRNVRNQVVEAYLPPLIVDENLEILRKNIANLDKMLQETKAIYEAGFVEQLDVDRLTLSLANLETEVQNLERQKELALNYLKFVIGYPVDEPIGIKDDLDDLLVPAADEDLTAPVVYQNRPEVKVAEAGIRLSDLNIKVNKDGYYPTVSGFANYQYVYQGDSFFGSDGFWTPTALAGLRINVPIFDGFSKKAKIERAEISRDISLNRLQLLKNSIDLEIKNSRTAYLTALERVVSQEKNVELAERVFETTRIKYKAGVGSSIEVTQAEQSLYQTQQNLIQARYDLLVAKQDLDTVLGK